MYCTMIFEDTARVDPKDFDKPIKESVLEALKLEHEGKIDPECGVLISVTDVKSVEDGMIIPGDPAVYYPSVFKVLTFKPELHEVIEGEVVEVESFGAFVRFGPIDGLVHVSQITDDYISYDPKKPAFSGKESSKSLGLNDKVRARVIAVSLKEKTQAKIGLTMRQPGLGKIEWIIGEREGTLKKGGKKKAKDTPEGENK